MSETTTIEITKSQRQRLRDVNSGSAKAAVDDLLNAYEGENGVDLSPVLERLDDVESAAKEATNAAQNAEQTITEATQS